MALDIKTLVMVLIVISFISAFALFFFYRILKQVNGLKHAAIGGGFQALASTCCIFILDTNNLTLAILMTDTSYFLSFVFYYQAARLLSEQKLSWTFPISFLCLLLPLIFIFKGHDYIDSRVLLTLSGIAVLLMKTSYVVFKSPAKLPSRLLLSFTFISSVFACLWTIVNLIISPDHIDVASDLSVLQFVFLWMTGTSFLITLSFIILTLEKLQEKLKVQVTLLGKARDIAHESLKEQRNFLSMLSHEFKGPIGAIQANVDAVMYLQTDKSPNVEDSLDRIKEVSKRLSGLVDHCLNNEWLSHSIENHEGQLEPLSLITILEPVCDEFSVGFKYVNSNVLISGDPIFLPLLFSNLIDNASRHARNISAVEVELTEDSQHYYVHVKDDGAGITKAQQQHIFDRYYRSDSDDSDGGSGLGLYFVKRITEMHGGSVTVNCEHNTVFTVIFKKLES